MSTYESFENKNKLQRAIERVKMESVSLDKREARIKELYISYGGRLSLEDIKEHIITNEEINATTNNKEIDNTVTEIKPRRGRPPRTDNSTVK